MKKLLLLLFLLTTLSWAQGNPAAMYSWNGSAWTPALSTGTAQALTWTPPPLSMYCFNSGLSQWVAADSSCFGGGGGGTGTVTSVSVVSANGFSGSVATPTTTPAITLSCPTCVLASSPGVGIAHFAGSTQTVTSSLVNLSSAADVTGTLPAANVVTGTSGAAIPLLNGANTYSGASTFSAAITNSVAGAASTPGLSITGTPFVGSGTTSTPQFYINNSANAPTTWNSSATGGTYFGINSQSGFAGNYFDFHVNGGGSFFSLASTGNLSTSGSLKGSAYLTVTNCAATGTAASPSVVSCTSAPAGAFACDTAATGATCQINTTAVTANSEINVWAVSDEGTRLGVTCNTAPTAPPAIILATKTAASGFTINLPTFSTNRVCYDFTITN